MTQPVFSIITPMWKGATLVGATIESVLAQTFTDWEMIIVDDCSPDDGAGATVVQSYADKDSRIKLIRATVNKGSSGARNEAMRNAQGRYFAFLDSDDIWETNYLQTMYKHIKANTNDNVAVYFCGYRFMDSKLEKDIHEPFSFFGTVTYKSILHYDPIFPSVAIVDREILKEPVYFREELRALRDDYVYWIDILRQGHIANGYPEILAKARLSLSSATGKKHKMIKPQWYVYRKVCKLNLFLAFFYLSCWALHGLVKYATMGKKGS